MRWPRVLFTVRGLMVVVVAAACLLAYRESLARVASPRTLVPPITAAYLTWALGYAALAVCVRSRRAWAVVPVLLALIVGVYAYQARATALRRMAGAHAWEGRLCRWGAEGQTGCIRIHCADGCRYWTIPTASGAAERASLLREAEDHARWQARYERAATWPWLAVGPGGPPLQNPPED